MQDDFTYRYYSGTNRLRSVVADASATTYRYDAIGNLTRDEQEGTNIIWNVYGKIKQVDKQDGSRLTFSYDAAGNRISKQLTKAGRTTTTHYLRDASGNVMAIYQDALLEEQPLYGSSRLGSYKGGRLVGERRLGLKQYELSNHLGNVLATVSDNISLSASETLAKTLSTTDYHPFGVQMEGRTLNFDKVRYGFNGKEKDDEWSKIDFGARVYNARLGLFLSLDPLFAAYPWQSPYVFAANNPIRLIDVNGEGPGDPTPANLQRTKTIIGNFKNTKGESVGGFILGALLYSPNFKPKNLWKTVHGYEKGTWLSYQGAVGEGIAAMNTEGAATGLFGGWTAAHTSFNPAQTALGKATTGTWDFKLEVTGLKREAWGNPFDNDYGRFTLASQRPDGSYINHAIDVNLDIGETATIYYELKTLSPNEGAVKEIVDAFTQATNTLNLHRGERRSFSAVMIDRDAFDYAYNQAKNGRTRIDAAFNAFQAAGGHLFLPRGHTQETKENMNQLYLDVKNGTSSETTKK